MTDLLPKGIFGAILFVVLQVVGGVSLGIATPLLLIGAVILGMGTGLLPDRWECTTAPPSSLSLSTVEFQIESETCTSGWLYAIAYTRIRASSPGSGAPAKIFEMKVRERDSAPVEIEAIDATTIRISLPAEYLARHPLTDKTIYVRLAKWKGISFVFGAGAG